MSDQFDVVWSGDWHHGGFGGYLNVIAIDTKDAPVLDPYQHVKLVGRRTGETPEQRRIRRLGHQRQPRYRCTVCKVRKSQDHFSRNASHHTGFAASCRACQVIDRAHAKMHGTWSGI